ncbi:MAG: RsmB/NOP family class I SAM-dependent RNA methyltransferase [Proteobacteria bacterium]|nr:RsmB/NOP family class I SAM-dependent RNA methyltransferase [Pseudomonadota bacterium]
MDGQALPFATHGEVLDFLRTAEVVDSVEIKGSLNRPLKRGHGDVRNLLRLGAVQLAFLDTPAHAAVSTTLNLATTPRLVAHKGLINALLRRIDREGAALIANQDAARLNTPRWLWQSWGGAYGDAAARAIAEAHLTEAPLDLTLKEPAKEPAEIAAWAERLEATLLPTGSLRLPPGRGEIAKLPGFEDGAWWVQDTAATLPVRLLGAVAGRRVVELCAAPGGKTAALATLGADVVAVEVSPARMARLEANLARLGLNAETVTADATGWRPPAPVDAVLLDAPCSGTGTLRRHPDIARLKRPDDIAALTALQDRLLAAAVEMTAPGGSLVYAACSLQPEEGPERIAALLAAGAPVARVPVEVGEVFGHADWLSPEGDLRSLPCHLAEFGGMDGFYACRLRRLA